MLVDLIAGGVIALAIVWGCTQGLQGTLPFAAFAVGAVIGTRLPLLLFGDLNASFSLVAAVPAALVLGAVLAAVVERLEPRLPRRLFHRAWASAAGGAVLAGSVGVAVVWILGPVAAEIDELRDPVESSTILARLNSALEPAGPERLESVPAADNFPTVDGPPPQVPPADPRAESDPDVLAAERSVVKVDVLSCGAGGQGSGWVADDGIVVTNAHVVAAADAITVQLRGTGPAREATPIWYDPANDLALLRVPELEGTPALPIVRNPQAGASGAALGFPAGERDIRRARLGPTTRERRGTLENQLALPGFVDELRGRLVTTFRGNSEGGSSGGPVVDTEGRVLTTVFGGGGLASGLGVPNRFVREALREAGPPISTGPCADESD